VPNHFLEPRASRDGAARVRSNPLVVVLSATVAVACASSIDPTGPLPSDGGPANGEASGFSFGAAPSNGGSPSSGGVSNGGSFPTGGTDTWGGFPTGGDFSTGGSGGTSSSGGLPSFGGLSGIGGSGGILVTGGAPGSGGTRSASCNNLACFDVFDCAFLYIGNTCAFTACTNGICK
jgi:hypothetical protein